MKHYSVEYEYRPGKWEAVGLRKFKWSANRLLRAVLSDKYYGRFNSTKTWRIRKVG